MTLTRLARGYWLARWTWHLWIQWPVGRAPTAADGFGWITDKHLDEAATAARKREGLAPKGEAV